MHSPSPPAELLSDLSRELASQLVGDSPEPDLDEVAIDIAWTYFEDSTDPDGAANEFVEDVLPRYRRCVVGFGYDDGPGTSLDLLELSADAVFVLVDRTSIDEGTRVIGEFQLDDTERLREFLRSEIAFGACTGENLSAWPEGIEISEPLTEDDVRSALVPLLTEYADEAERFAEVVERATGSIWPTRSLDDRRRLAQAYVSLALGVDIPEEPTEAPAPLAADDVAPGSDRSASADPTSVSDQTLHEPEGDPLQEPWVQQEANAQPRREPILVFTVGDDVDLKQAAKQIARRVIDAQSRND